MMARRDTRSHRKHRRQRNLPAPLPTRAAVPPEAPVDPALFRERAPPELPAPTSNWRTFDADATHGTSQLFRAVMGVVAGLLGSLIAGGLLKDGARMASPSNLSASGLDETMLALLIFVLSAPVLLAFAVGQAIHLLWVGGDERFDARLWARLDAAERGERIRRAARKAAWTYLTWWWLTFLGLVYAQYLLYERIVAGLLVLRWQAAVLPLLTVALVWVGLRMRPRFATTPDSTSAAAGQRVWVSRHHWGLQAQRDGWVDRLTLMSPAIALAAGAWALLSGGTSRDPSYGVLYAIGAAVAVVYGWREIVRGKRDWLAGSNLDIVRISLRPLRMRCVVRFAASPDGGRVVGRWVAMLRGRYGRYGVLTFACAAAPVTISADGMRGWFELEITLPPASKYPLFAGVLVWRITISPEGRKVPAVSFLIPQEIIYPEEFPA